MARKHMRALVPLDGSMVAENAIRWAERLQSIGNLELILFNVNLPPRAAVLIAPFVGRDESVEEGASRGTAAYLEILANDLKEKGTDAICEVQELEGSDESIAELRAHFVSQIGSMIVERAEKDDIDLVIITSQGMTNRPDVRWGSVSQYLLSHVGKPLLTIPNG